MNPSTFGFDIRGAAIALIIISTSPYRVEEGRLTHGRYTNYERNKFVATMTFYILSILTLTLMSYMMALMEGNFAHV